MQNYLLPAIDLVIIEENEVYPKLLFGPRNTESSVFFITNNKNENN